MYPGDFHDFMHFFSNCGKFVSSSGSDEILYQARMCSAGEIRPVLSGKFYSMCRRIHEVVVEAIYMLQTLISVILVYRSKLDHPTLNKSKK